MPHHHRFTKRRLPSTLLALCFFAGAIGESLKVPNSSYAQSPLSLSAEQTTALSEAERLIKQVGQLFQEGKFSEANPLAQRALAILKRNLGENHPDVIASLYILASLYEEQGRYSEAEPLFKQILELRKRTLGENHLDVARSLNDLAFLYEDQGRYSEAEPLFKQALEVRKRALGETHPDVVSCITFLAHLYRKQRRYSEAETLYKQALEVTKRSLGETHPDFAGHLNNLAMLYREQRRYVEAETLFKQALALRKRASGETHPDEVAISLGSLAGLYEEQGRYSEAEPLLKQALELRKRASGETHPDVVVSLNNLANLYLRQGRYGEAEPLFKQALELRKRTLGETHPDVATSLNNLAVLYSNQGRYSEAEPLFKQALELRKRIASKNYVGLAANLDNLATLYMYQGRYGEAEPLLKQALELRKRTLGEAHPDVATSLNNLAVLYENQGDPERSIAFLNQGIQIEEQNLDIHLIEGSEQQKRDYIATFSGTTGGAISLHLQAAPTNPDAARLALTAILQRKGRILDALTDNLNRLRQHLTPANQTLLDNLASVRTQLATLYYSGLGKLSPEQYKDRVTQLQKQSTQLEADLNNRSVEFRTKTQPITVTAVQKLIPADAALVELVRYYPFNPKAKYAERWSMPHYAAYILSPQGTIQAVDLGDAAAIDLQAEAFRIALRNRDSRVKAIARQLDAKLMQPIRAKLGNTHNLLISPDSQLNLIPFAALVDEQNHYLVETYNIDYLTSGRDLLRLQTSIASRQPPILVANPDYADPGDPTSTALVQKASKIASSNPANLVASTKPIATRSANQRSTNLASLRVKALPGTLAEANAIAPKLKDAIVLTGAQATENALKQVHAPRILHIATHGFFLEDAAPATLASRSPMLIPVLNESNSFGGLRPPISGNTENALLRSGLALAGFNVRQSGSEDGVLTAQEAAGLDLRGTQLVVLSACETGIGNVANGEGVYGLRRAFVLAGAASQLTSLWQVSDAGTKDLMVRYYDRLLANQGRSDALRQTQLQFLHSSNYQHPYYWAAFVPSGDWRPLK